MTALLLALLAVLPGRGVAPLPGGDRRAGGGGGHAVGALRAGPLHRPLRDRVAGPRGRRRGSGATDGEGDHRPRGDAPRCRGGREAEEGRRRGRRLDPRRGRCSPGRRKGSGAASPSRTPRPAGRGRPAPPGAVRGSRGRSWGSRCASGARREACPTRWCCPRRTPASSRTRRRRSRRARRPASGAPCPPRPAPSSSGRSSSADSPPSRRIPRRRRPGCRATSRSVATASRSPRPTCAPPGTTGSRVALVVGVAWDGTHFVWHEWVEVAGARRWIAVDPSFRQLPAQAPRFAVARFSPGDEAGRAEAGRKVLACWGKARISRTPPP